MIHDCYTWGEKQKLVNKMNQDWKMKVIENNIVSSINSSKDEISNIKEIVIKNLQSDKENLEEWGIGETLWEM